MFKNYFFILLLFLGGFLLLSTLSGKQMNSLLSSEPKIVTKNTQMIKVGDKKLEVEVVSDDIGLRNGLSNREEIGSDGMLFIFPVEQTTSFWMKDMKFDLDIIWIKSGIVTEITKNVPRPINKSDKLILYSPKSSIDMVLEVKSGDSDELGISVGDQITLVE
jgi:uncharacterized protein